MNSPTNPTRWKEVIAMRTAINQYFAENASRVPRCTNNEASVCYDLGLAAHQAGREILRRRRELGTTTVPPGRFHYNATTDNT